MGWLPVLMGAAASVIFYRLAELVWLTASASATIGGFWSWGVMHNYATEVAKRRSGLCGSFWDISQPEAESVPNWITMINLVFSMACLGLFLAALTFVL